MKLVYLSFLLILSLNLSAQEFTPNYDESKIPVFELPPILVANDGTEINTAEQWEQIRRNEIMDDFEVLVYGKIPEGSVETKTTIIKETDALNGKATMKQVKMTFSKNERKISMDILMILPKTNTPVPVFVGLNFYGNQSIFDDPNILLPVSWVQNNEDFGITQNIATERSRGVRHYRWAVERIIERGYGLVTIFYGDIDPDKDDFSDGVHALFYDSDQSKPKADEWGSIAAWAWGLSRTMDYLETDKKIDPSKVIVMGHSRLGKASLWAGALDQRFAMVISNDSGCGGAALSKRRIGETVGRINRVFPHWFADNFNQFNENEEALPLDQHMLIALVAPRPVYVTSAVDDRWADPKGEFLSAYYAGEVYTLYGLEGIPTDQIPKTNQPILNSVGYHIRTGGHDVTDYDWVMKCLSADIHLK